MPEALPVLCPSYRCESGAVLLGIVQSDGHVAIAGERIEIDESFVESAKLGRAPEGRFRFAGKCAQSGCTYWSQGARCDVIDRVLGILGPKGSAEELPACAIRSQCRWYIQIGAAACAVCPEVVTNRGLADRESEVR